MYNINETDAFKYRGEFKEGLRHGKGIIDEKYTYYKGEWKNDKEHGKGVLNRKDAIFTISGNFVNGKTSGFT